MRSPAAFTNASRKGTGPRDDRVAIPMIHFRLSGLFKPASEETDILSCGLGDPTPHRRSDIGVSRKRLLPQQRQDLEGRRTETVSSCPTRGQRKFLYQQVHTAEKALSEVAPSGPRRFSQLLRHWGLDCSSAFDRGVVDLHGSPWGPCHRAQPSSHQSRPKLPAADSGGRSLAGHIATPIPGASAAGTSRGQTS